MFLTVPVPVPVPMPMPMPMPETEAEHAAESTRCCLKRLRKATGRSAKKTGHGHGHGHEQTPERQSLLGSHRQRRWFHEAMKVPKMQIAKMGRANEAVHLFNVFDNEDGLSRRSSRLHGRVSGSG